MPLTFNCRTKRSWRSCAASLSSSANGWAATECPSPGLPSTWWTLWTALAVWRETQSWRWASQVMQSESSRTSNVIWVLIFHRNLVPLLKHCKEETATGPQISSRAWDCTCHVHAVTSPFGCFFFSFYLETTSEQKSNLNREENCHVGISYWSCVILSLTAGVYLTLNLSKCLRCSALGVVSLLLGRQKKPVSCNRRCLMNL